MAGGLAFDKTRLLGADLAPFQKGDSVKVLRQGQLKGKMAVVIEPLFKPDIAKVEMDEKDTRGQIKTIPHSELEFVKQQESEVSMTRAPDLEVSPFVKGAKVRILKESRMKGKLATVTEYVQTGKNAMVRIEMEDGQTKVFFQMELELLSRQELAALAAPGVRVFVRLRPPEEDNDVEREGFQLFEFDPSRIGRVTIKDPLSAGRTEHTYEFNRVFDPKQNQDHLFAPLAEPTVDAAIEGCSGCIVAYGQTGSGKTYSIFGERSSGSTRGLLPRSVERLFENLKERADTTLREPPMMSSLSHNSKSSNINSTPAPSVSVSFLEVYIDRVRDLGRFSLEDTLADTDFSRSGWGKSHSPPRSAAGKRSFLSGAANTSFAACPETSSLDIREGPSGTVHVKGLTMLPVHDSADVQHIINKGLSGRAAAAQASGNDQSSRTHTIFTVYIPRQPDPTATDTEDLGHTTLSFVDLAGSERLAKSKADGSRFHEAVSINSSLTALGKVVLALTKDGSSLRHVPYRDAKLTRILSPAFADGANVVILATVHPRLEDYEETLHTLSWADGCKNMQRQPQVTYISQKKCADIRIKDLQEQMVKLKEHVKEAQAEVAAQMSNCGVSGIGGFGKVDEIDMEIAKVLINDSNDTSKLEPETSSKAAAAAGTNKNVSRQATSDVSAAQSAGSKRDSKESWIGDLSRINIVAESEKREKREQTARDRSIAALAALQEERGRQSEAHEKAEMRMRILEKEQTLLSETELGRQGVRKVLLERGQELDAELASVQEKLRDALEDQREDHDLALQAISTTSEKRLQQADEPLLRIQMQLQMMKDITEKKREGWEDSREKAEKDHVDRVRKIKEGQAKQLQDLASQWSTRIAEKEAMNAQYMEELALHRDSSQKTVTQCQEELLSLYALILKLSKLTADIEDGRHPFVWLDGLKEVALPEGTRPTLPSVEAYPQLFIAVAAEEKVTPLERMAQQPLSSGRCRRAGTGGIAAIAAAEAIRKSAESTATNTSREGGMADANGDNSADVAAWNAASIAGKFYEAEDESKAEILLESLAVAHLRRLCVELRDHSVGRFAPGDEREALRRTALAALEDGSTEHYIRDLEQRRYMEQSALSDAVEKGLQIRGWLGSRKSSLASPQDGMSRLPSRTITPCDGRSHPSSRSGSRPTTATSSRLPPHPAYLRQGTH